MNDFHAFTLSPADRQRIKKVDDLAAQGAHALPRLVAMLGDPSWVIRRAVVGALAAQGDAAVPLLKDVLTGTRTNETTLAAAVDVLGSSSGDVDCAMESLLDHPNPAIVSDAIVVLGRRKARSYAGRVAQLLDHADENVAVVAIEALGRMGGRAALHALIEAARSRKFFRTFPAIELLGRSEDPRAVEPLVELLEDPLYAREAARALERTGDRQAAAPLAERLTARDDATVRLMAFALCGLARRYAEKYGIEEPIHETIRGKVAVDATARRLASCLADADPDEQMSVCRLLGVLGTAESTPELRRLLRAAPPVAAAAAEALHRIGSAAADELRQALSEGDSEQRLAVLPNVSRPQAMDAVVTCLSDASAEVRVAACEALARIGSARGLESLFRMLHGQPPAVVQAAAAAIQALGGGEVEAYALQALRSAEPEARRAALRIMAYFGLGSASHLYLNIAREDSDSRVRDAAIQALPLLDDPCALDALIELAADPVPRARAQAVRAMGETSGEMMAVSRVMVAVSDPDPWVRYYACRSLGKLGVESAVRLLEERMHDEAGQVRVAAIEGLSHLRGEHAMRALSSAASSRNPDVRRAAVLGLGISRSPEALSSLLDAFASDDPATRLVAVSALAGFYGRPAIDALRGAMTDSDPMVRSAAVGVLAAHGAPESAQILIDALRAGIDDQTVVEALSVAMPGRIEVILGALENADDELSLRLTTCLARMRTRKAADALAQALASPNVAARKASATSLAAVNMPEGRAALRHASRHDPDTEVRSICSLALGEAQA